MSLVQFVEHMLLHVANHAPARRGKIQPDTEPPLALPPADHVVLGHAIPRQPELVTLSPEARLRHLYALGSSGSGKTNLLLRLIESDITAHRTFCVIDLRGDLIDRILPRLHQEDGADSLAERTLLLDLRQEEFAVAFNPLTGPGDPYARALHVLSVLRQQSDSWGVQLEETLRNCLIALASAGGTLLDIEPLLHRPLFREQILSRVSDSQVRSFFERYNQLSGERQTTWSLPVMNKITPLLAVPRLRRMLGQQQTLPLQDFLDKKPGSILLVALAVDRLHQCAHQIGALLVSSLQSAIMARVDQPEAKRVPVHLYVDEFETMATEQFEAIIAEGRRFGLGLCLSHQNLSQLPASLRQTLLNNVQTQLYFQTGAGDASDLAREIVSGQTAEEVRQTLMTQAVGEAYLVRRGQGSLRIRVPCYPEPAVEPVVVQAQRGVILRRHGRPHAEIDRELVARDAPPEDALPVRKMNTPDAAAEVPPLRAQKKEQKDKTKNYEVRHASDKGKFLFKPSDTSSPEAKPPENWEEGSTGDDGQ